jgi:branched-chain amino acid transport system permease protein
MNVRVASFGKLKRLLSSYLALAVLGIGLFLGGGAMIEMVYHLQLNGAMGDELEFLGQTLNARSVGHWVASAALLLVSLGLFEWVRRRFRVKWEAVQLDIEQEIKRRETP